ncbi:MAG: carbon-nitrogen hydrolase family protein [Christensenellales bacterium]
MSILKIALMQIASCGSLDGNLKKGLECCEKAAARGADIALFPEMWSNGYAIYDRPAEEWTRDAIPLDGEFMQEFACAARRLNMAVGVTLLEQYSPAPRNTLALFDRHGRRAFTYAKVHTCDFDAERSLTPGDDFPVCELDTARGAVKVGAMICYDREFPESARVLMLRGAELILVPNACPMEINRLSQLRGRAYENMLAVATCNYPAGVPDCNGGSSAFDGVVYLPELSGSRDTCLVQAGGEEGIYMAELDLDMLRNYRAREIHGNAFRRPEMYGDLVKAEIRAPFIRKERRK